MYAYSPGFFDHVDDGAAASAAAVVPLVRRLVPVTSVVDFGCGRGAWLAAWRGLGVTDVTGVDGDYVDRASLLIDPAAFMARDLTAPVALGRTFDLVQSLEVAEHLPASAADRFVDTLVRHGPVVLFSAAVPGQGGEHHQNEQPYGYWRGRFRARGYVVLDVLRPHLAGDRSVMPWYRYNLLLYVDRSLLADTLAGLARFRIGDAAPIPDVSPFPYRLRKACLRRLPPGLVTWIAIRKRMLRSGPAGGGAGRDGIEPPDHTTGGER